MNTEISLRLESFELRLDDISAIPLDQLHALSMSVRWPHRPDDWQMLREMGHGIAAVDEIGRILGTAMWFPNGPDFATVGMVITTPRLQEHGAGRWLMDALLAQVGPRLIRLNATRAARRLYRSLGFAAEQPVYQCQGEAVAPPAQPMTKGGAVRRLGIDDLAAITQLDRHATGADRHSLLTRILTDAGGLALMRGDCIDAFALCRRFGRGYVIGPIVAGSDADAIAVTMPLVLDHVGDFVRVDTMTNQGVFAAFLADAGLATFDVVTAMALDQRGGAGPLSGRQQIYGLASQALG